MAPGKKYSPSTATPQLTSFFYSIALSGYHPLISDSAILFRYITALSINQIF
ncbi:hypothetical protein SARI_04395 [Salmonella enterica subsp. arizonae serovar 62:z4,z23:-]|uniref:Uncharacterized protein n=1 Tax=Salmonella arizonae (strain ATCC BAA-731 / CDC346-86 / RSK2980) TaxID=41514 RepID=A9MPT0_SALAR|nr:hypothetical protein SARI_04395 [Salmonella enterica subsp. arizonae serovar 62:z4,z23:-]